MKAGSPAGFVRRTPLRRAHWSDRHALCGHGGWRRQVGRPKDLLQIAPVAFSNGGPAVWTLNRDAEVVRLNIEPRPVTSGYHLRAELPQ